MQNTTMDEADSAIVNSVLETSKVNGSKKGVTLTPLSKVPNFYGNNCSSVDLDDLWSFHRNQWNPCFEEFADYKKCLGLLTLGLCK